MPHRNRIHPFIAAIGFAAFISISGPFARGENEAFSDPAVLDVGKRIYQSACAACHGDQGQGVESAYANALVGDESIGQLVEIIADTMPEEDPQSCVGDDAIAVAAYIHHAFYSEAAQVRNRPPSIALARLTADQLRHSLADLYAHFAGKSWMHQEHGLEGLYFDGARWKSENQKIKRVDPVIDFDFGHDGPGEGIAPEEFFIRWYGTLMVDRTGEHEIVLRSTCSCKMHFGDTSRVFVDNHVQSEGRTEFRERVHLVAGRGYPIELTFTQRKRKTQQPPAKVSLSWIPPGGAEEIIPRRNLLSTGFPAAFALQAKLPPDDRSYGYERGTEISRIWDESTTQAAVEFSGYAVDELWPRYQRKHQNDSSENRAQLRRFLTELVGAAFRGALDDSTRQVYIDKQVDASEDDGEVIRRVCLLTLKSPRFLYPTLDSNQTVSQRVANRLALVMYDSIPVEDGLRKKVEQNELQTADQIKQAASSMLNDYRLRAKVRAFLYQWFDVAGLDEIVKDEQQYAGFDRFLVSDLRASFDAFVDDVVWSDASDFRQLLEADWTYTTDRLAAFYGDAWKPLESEGARLRRSVSEPQFRMGLLSHPLVMSEKAYFKSTSPIHRGVFLNRRILGRTLRPPNAAFAPLNADLHPGLTTRERVALQTEEVNCQVCHQKINPLGFALENFDAVGRWRATEKNRPIDASGNYLTRDGKEVTFNGAKELATFLAASEDCHRAFVEAAFEHFTKQSINAYGTDTLERMTREFRESGFNIRDLIVSIATTAASEPILPTVET